MAGVTTASRSAWGIIASSEAMNPVVGSGEISYSNGIQGNFYINNIPNTEWRDLELWIHWNQSSTWSGQGEFWMSTNSSGANADNWGGYNYWGWSTGSSYGTNINTGQYVYPVSYSNMYSSMHFYCANAFDSTNTKAWWYEAGHSNGNNTSYACVQRASGVYRNTNPVDQMYFSTPWGNGSSSYQGWLMIGRNPK
jgi:hypothetical protein